MKTKTVLETTIGLDLGDKRHAVCVLDSKGEIIEERTVSNTRESLSKLARRYPQARVALEAGSHSPWISRWLKGLDCEVLVANARKLRAIYQNERKSDALDARMLAKLARVDPSLLHPIEHGSEQAQRDLLRIKLRDNLVRQRVDIISSVRFTLKSLGIRLPSPSTACFARRARTLLENDEPELLAMIAPSLEVLDAMTVRIRQLDREIEQLCETNYPQSARLRAIRGVGPITALSFILTIGSPERFTKPRDVGAYLGMVPKRDQSGGTDKSLRISKSGNTYLRRLLVSCAQYILGPFGEDCDLRSRGLRLIERGGRGAKKKAVIATARKLSVLMLTLWRHQTDYQPQRQAA
jgi:transposase